MSEREGKLLAKIGELTLAIEHRDSSFDILLGITGKIVTGEIHPSRVLVNLTSKTCDVVPTGQVPAVPPQINGLPVCCVYAPPPVGEPD